MWFQEAACEEKEKPGKKRTRMIWHLHRNYIIPLVSKGMLLLHEFEMFFLCVNGMRGLLAWTELLHHTTYSLIISNNWWHVYWPCVCVCLWVGMDGRRPQDVILLPENGFSKIINTLATATISFARIYSFQCQDLPQTGKTISPGLHFDCLMGLEP